MKTLFTTAIIKNCFKNRIAVPLIVLMFASFTTRAQQDPLFKHFMYTNMTFNPGYAGSQDKVYATITAGQQMMGMPGNPRTFNGAVNAPFSLFGADHGVGLCINNDQWGFNADNFFKVAYAYRANLGNGKLGIGLGLNIIFSTLDADWETTEAYPNVTSEQLQAMGIPASGENNGNSFDADFGLYYVSDDLYLGISSTKVLQQPVEYSSGSTQPTTGGSGLTYGNARHYFITTGYTFQLSNPSYEIQPNILFKSAGTGSQVDLNLMLYYNKRIWGGVTFRNSEIDGLLGFQLSNNLRLGVSYGYPMSMLSRAVSGSTEILINYSFQIIKEKVPQRYKSIRYL